MLSSDSLPALGERALFFPEKTVPLWAMLGSVGHSRRTDHTYNWHGLKRGSTEFSLLQHTLQGRGRLRIGNRHHDVKAGDTMLLHFPDDNQYWLPADSTEWQFLYVCLHGREVARLWRSLENSLGALVRFSPNASPIACVRHIVEAALEGQITNAFAASSLAYELTMCLAMEARTSRTNLQAQPALERARLYTEKHLHEPLTVEIMAQQAGFSRFHFSRLFAAHTGLSPTAWLTEQRVREAARLLRSTRLPLKEIAARCGFPNANYLSRVFRRHSGMPPATYRRSGA